VVYLGTGALTLQDISAAGKVIFTRDDWRAGMIGFTPSAPAEIELSWHDWTFVRDISDDGKTIAFDETGEAGGETGATYVRGSDGSLAVRLGDGNFPTLSPDGKHILAITPGPQGGRALTEYPIGAGDSRTISTGDVHVQEAYYFPDGHHILDVGAIGSEGQRLWVQDNQGGAPRSISPEGAAFRYRGCISPDGKSVAALGPGGKPTIYHVDGSNPSPIPGVLEGDEPVRWMIDGRSLLVGRSEIPMRIFTLDLATGHRKFFKEISPPDLTGLLDSEPPNYSRDLQSYAYSYTRIMSDLYLADGMK
jgi:eukaryotic-like serine/threonine-protein kinase